MSYQCAVIGDITLDRFILFDTSVYPAPLNPGNYILPLELGQKISVKNTIESIGGNAYNVSFGLNMIGISPILVSTIGNDDISKKAISSIKNSHIISDYIVCNDISNINTSTILSVGGERVILSHHTPKDYTQLTIPSTEWLYITSMSKGSNDYIEKILLDAQSHKIAFNPGSYLINHHIHLIHRLLPHISLLFVNKEEAQSITNNPDEEHIPHLIQLLHQLGADIVCLTDGINGAYVSNQSHILYAPSRIVSIAETTGAGDAFSAAFLGAYIQGKSLDTALKWGIIQSSSVIQHIGSTNGLIPQPEIELLLQDIIVETL